jgi:hypothetical protein
MHDEDEFISQRIFFGRTQVRGLEGRVEISKPGEVSMSCESHLQQRRSFDPCEWRKMSMPFNL